VAFSFEMKNASVYSLAVDQNQLFVGLKSGRIDCYKLENTMSLKSIGHHSKTVTSLIASNGSIFSSSFDGTILKISSKGDGNFLTVHKSNSEPLKSLAVRNSFWVALQGDTKIVFGHMSFSSELITSIDFQTPLRCLALTESIILAGSKSGIIYGWSIQSLQPVFALKGHVSPVNNLMAVDERLFSASDDKTIIEWFLESQIAIKTYKRISASALGHLGPVISLSYCSDTLFSAGSDLTVRRWNTKTGKHDDVYFGFTKSVTVVLCYNGSVFAGSEDFSVLMFRPSLPQSKGATVNPSGTVLKRSTKRGKVVRLQRAAGSSINVTQIAVSVTAVVVVITTLFGCICYKKKVKKNGFQTELAVTTLDNLTAQTALDLATVVNSVMGISKHAAYLIENSALAKIKRLTAGGGGEVFLAKIMDASLRKKFGEIIIQKVVFAKDKVMEEAFYQEVGIMILLNSFPHFCTILGYTEKPLSIVLKYYPDGSLHEWIRKTQMTKSLVLMIVKEISEALNVMHSHYLAHCDIKPQNVLVQVENGIPSCFLTDFGITQVLSDQIVATGAFHVINLRGLSIPYAAPEALENFRSKSYTGADFKKYDIYSFACVLHEVLLQKGP
jgi:tRNA A-37 threonylcarbamoyl transferase component Bud32